MRTLKILILVAVALAGASLALANGDETITINYRIGSIDVRLIYALIVMLGLGVMIGLISLILPYTLAQTRIRKLEKSLRLAQTEIKNLRTTPLPDVR